MNTETNYQQAKRHLKDNADTAKSQFNDDKPMIRQIINDTADIICKDSHYNLADYQKDLLHNYACTLHPKK